MATETAADEYVVGWLESDEGRDASEELTLAKREDLLMRSSNGKVGLYMSADGAWQKRKKI